LLSLVMRVEVSVSAGELPLITWRVARVWHAALPESSPDVRTPVCPAHHLGSGCSPTVHALGRGTAWYEWIY